MSRLWTSQALVAAMDGRPLGPMPEGVDGISIDTRTLQPGDAFFSIKGEAMDQYFAMIAAWTGEKELACERLTATMRRPNGLSYGQLKLLPFWEPLRGDPRFETIVASLAPR